MYENWHSSPLRDLCHFISGSGFPEHLQGRDNGELPFYKVSDMSSLGNGHFLLGANNYVSRELARKRGWKTAPAGAVVFAKVGAALLLNRRRLLSKESIIDNNMVAVVANDSTTNSWLYWQLLCVDFADFVQDGALPSINQRQIGDISIPKVNATEAFKISEILETLDAAINENQAIIAKLKAVKQGLLHDLLTRGIAANGELRPPQAEAPHLYKMSPLGWIPMEWEVAPLGELSESLVDGPFGSNLKTAHYVENPGVRVVRLRNILAGEYDDTERAFISERHAASLERNRVTTSDTLIASLDDASYPVGRSCCYPADLPDAINKADCFRFRSGPRCRNEFVMLSMNGAAARKQVRGYEQGVTMKRINLGNLRRVEIALLSVPEQEMIAVRLGTMQKQIDVTSLELQKLRFEKAGLMDDLLTGRVRVTPLLEGATQ
jgi:type I restriction enzyme, S subunit